MYLGIDTSNYTTSVALFDGENVVQKKKLLNVRQGERGLRQSEAVFQHTVNLRELFEELDFDNTNNTISGVGVSTRPRNVQGSYMPCFLVGESVAAAVSKFTGAPLYRTSHQTGHILAALYSAGRLDLLHEQFIAFHVSGGTTEALLVSPDSKSIIDVSVMAQSTDLKAGQAIDRAGVMMGLDFPCGKELDKLSLLSDKTFDVRPSAKGCDCSFSGIENKAHKMYNNGCSREDIAKFVITYISASIEYMASSLLDRYGNLPLLFAGGVMSNTLIRKNIKGKFNAYFAEPAFSCDNAAGTAVYAYLEEKNDHNNSITD